MFRSAVQRRLLSTSRTAWKEASFNSPESLVQKKQQEILEHEQFSKTLLESQFRYEPKTITENVVDPQTKRPTPLNVELLKYKPIRVPKTHGHEVATVKFRGYSEDDLIITSEFAARAAYYLGIPCSAVTKEKTEKRLYTVIRSPFAQAKSKENFYRTTFNYKLIAYDSNPEVVDLWLSYLNKYALEGVKYTSAVHTRESLHFVEELDKLTVDDLQVPQSYRDGENPVLNKVNEILSSETFKEFFQTEAGAKDAEAGAKDTEAGAKPKKTTRAGAKAAEATNKKSQ